MKFLATFRDYCTVIKLVNFINDNGVFSAYIGKFENVFDIIKEVYCHYSGGGFEHLMIHLNNGHIIVYDYSSNTLEYSDDAWDSIQGYISNDENENGFGYEANKDDYEDGKRFVMVDISKYILTEGVNV